MNFVKIKIGILRIFATKLQNIITIFALEKEINYKQ